MGRSPCCDKANVKRGPWSPEEDALLRSYIEKYGTGGNWIALPQKAGLNRCGKSSRLRWLNYLRPDIKHGGFTEEEDNIICSLYKKLGSRWSIIASRLRGRTDNDVKNYWNTKLKKKLMARETSPGTNITSNTIHSSPSPTPTPPPVFLPAIKAGGDDTGDISMSVDSSIFALTQGSHKFYSETSPFSMMSLMQQREELSANVKGQFLGPSEEVSVTSSTVTVDNGSSDSYKNWSAGGANADDLFLSDLDFGYLSDLLGGYGREEKLGEVSPYSFWATSETMPQQGLYQSVTYW